MVVNGGGREDGDRALCGQQAFLTDQTSQTASHPVRHAGFWPRAESWREQKV